MSEIRVRPARANECVAVGELTVAAYAAGGHLLDGDDYGLVLRDAADRLAAAELLVAVDGDDTLLGTVTVTPHGSAYAELCRAGELEFRMLAVLPEAQGRGVGEALARAVLERAHERGADRVVLCSLAAMTGAHRLYGRLGFTRREERDWYPKPDIALLAFALEL